MVFQSLVSFKVYLYNSVRNASLDYLKHKNIEGSYLQKMLDAHPVYRTGEEDEEGFFSEEVYRQLFETIDALPERCREVFLMYMEGKKNEEVATALHVSIETVKNPKEKSHVYSSGRNWAPINSYYFSCCFHKIKIIYSTDYIC